MVLKNHWESIASIGVGILVATYFYRKSRADSQALSAADQAALAQQQASSATQSAGALSSLFGNGGGSGVASNSSTPTLQIPVVVTPPMPSAGNGSIYSLPTQGVSGGSNSTKIPVTSFDSGSGFGNTTNVGNDTGGPPVNVAYSNSSPISTFNSGSGLAGNDSSGPVNIAYPSQTVFTDLQPIQDTTNPAPVSSPSDSANAGSVPVVSQYFADTQQPTQAIAYADTPVSVQPQTSVFNTFDYAAPPVAVAYSTQPVSTNTQPQIVNAYNADYVVGSSGNLIPSLFAPRAVTPVNPPITTQPIIVPSGAMDQHANISSPVNPNVI